MGNALYLPNLRKPVTGTEIGQKKAIDVNILSGVNVQVLSQGANDGSNVESTVSTVKTESPPSGALGFILMNNDNSTQNIRWRIGAVAGAAAGSQLQPGRDTGYIPCAAPISICAESGTQNYNLQWILVS